MLARQSQQHTVPNLVTFFTRVQYLHLFKRFIKRGTIDNFLVASFYNRLREDEEVKYLLADWFLWFILFSVVVLISLMAIGGFFMFRKFLKALPKQDGKSD
ncbi:hypothetical protein LSPH24S_06722 [Lysinibacillus sphaericus]